MHARITAANSPVRGKIPAKKLFNFFFIKPPEFEFAGEKTKPFILNFQSAQIYFPKKKIFCPCFSKKVDFFLKKRIFFCAQKACAPNLIFIITNRIIAP
jgi:hypothetical protein